MKGKFEVFEGYYPDTRIDSRGARVKCVKTRYYFRLKSGNGKIICQSEGYNSKAACMKGIAAIKKLAKDAPVVDV